MATLQEALKNSGLRPTTPNTTIDLKIVPYFDLWIFTAETWQGHQFLNYHTDENGQTIIDTAKRANELSRQAVSQGLNVALDGKPFKGGL
jgi:hypothetical protein